MIGGNVGPQPAAPGPPPQIAVTPVRTQITVGTVPSTAGAVVFLRTDTATGTHVVFLAATDAIEVAAQLRYHGKAAKSGLALPPSAAAFDDDESPNGHHP